MTEIIVPCNILYELFKDKKVEEAGRIRKPLFRCYKTSKVRKYRFEKEYWRIQPGSVLKVEVIRWCDVHPVENYLFESCEVEEKREVTLEKVIDGKLIVEPFRIDEEEIENLIRLGFLKEIS